MDKLPNAGIGFAGSSARLQGCLTDMKISFFASGCRLSKDDFACRMDADLIGQGPEIAVSFL